MDKAIRNVIQRATQDARRLLEREFSAQLEGSYDILPDGTILPASGLRIDPRERLVREKLVATIEHHRAAGMSPKAALDRIVREAAFTTLNRFVALKMSEARGLVQECVSRGDQSSGFREFGSLAPGLVSLPDKGYRLYIESLWDEIGREVRVLFDRRDVASLIWPRQPALDELLRILNDPQLATVWCEDETIGWVYQYFNGEDERQAMRDPKRGGSQAPRNSRELAVRNQFFTPRYVVEFLTDNTLGRTWYEMRRGSTRLTNVCRYLVRRPHEFFLAQGESPPAETTATTDDERTQEELLNEPVYIPYRELKDPRSLRILDPASGSGHFLLYCFDLLLLIYEEAWDDCPELLADLRSSLPDKATFMRRMPGMILAHNLHGIDIDPRAAQIAELALWMRAHRAYGDMNVPRAERPAVRRTNIVVAEPMPGDRDLLREFLQTIDERLRPLVTTVWEKMRLAGEAGSLLKIDEEIEGAIKEARVESLVDAPPVQVSVFDGGKPPRQEVISFASDEDRTFWDKAEEHLLNALHDYAAQATGAQGMQRRLFAENAAQGFAFVDICRKRYDIVLMNPPFGEGVSAAKEYLANRFSRSMNDLFATFVDRLLGLLSQDGFLGAITPRTGFFLSSFKQWREEVLLQSAPPSVVADLGYGVLDDAMVETAAYCLRKRQEERSTFFRLLNEETKDLALAKLIEELRSASCHRRTFLAELARFRRLPNSPLAYWITENITRMFSLLPRLESDGRIVRVSNETGDDFRYMRLWNEVAPRDVGRKALWVPHAKGGPYRHFSYDLHLLIAWHDERRTVRGYCGRPARPDERVACSDLFFRPGLTYPRRTNRFSSRVLPKGSVFSNKGAAILANGDDPQVLLALLALTNSEPFVALLQMQSAAASLAQSFEVGLLQKTPVPELHSQHLEQLAALGEQGFRGSLFEDVADEFTHFFVAPGLLQFGSGRRGLRAAFEEWEANMREASKLLEECRERINEFVSNLYKFSQADKVALADSLHISEPVGKSEDEETLPSRQNIDDEVVNIVLYAVGCALGRWDITAVGMIIEPVYHSRRAESSRVHLRM